MASLADLGGRLYPEVKVRLGEMAIIHRVKLFWRVIRPIFMLRRRAQSLTS